ncbi:UNKNOWN [Stylonychia lemnae]|uniref:Uncharacterized protein n=1 Tax=Stylonychia lemnae TaxID=5949 RepID=A0A077ZR10_STYLE|nr:UNKNOWN [Stylonychia lemnae]|eukprot:CDW72322.1 UNKNOWN [Stylonychia lemnae]
MIAQKYIFISAVLTTFLGTSFSISMKADTNRRVFTQSSSLIKKILASQIRQDDDGQNNSTQFNSTGEYYSTEENNSTGEYNYTDASADSYNYCPYGNYNLTEDEQSTFDSLVEYAWQVVTSLSADFDMDKEEFRAAGEQGLQQLCYQYQFEWFVNQTYEELNRMSQGYYYQNYTQEDDNQTYYQTWVPSEQDLKKIDQLVSKYVVELVLIKQKEVQQIAEAYTNYTTNPEDFERNYQELERYVNRIIAELNGDYSYSYSNNYYAQSQKNTTKPQPHHPKRKAKAQLTNFWDHHSQE